MIWLHSYTVYICSYNYCIIHVSTHFQDLEVDSNFLITLKVVECYKTYFDGGFGGSMCFEFSTTVKASFSKGQSSTAPLYHYPETYP